MATSLNAQADDLTEKIVCLTHIRNNIKRLRESDFPEEDPYLDELKKAYDHYEEKQKGYFSERTKILQQIRQKENE